MTSIVTLIGDYWGIALFIYLYSFFGYVTYQFIDAQEKAICREKSAEQLSDQSSNTSPSSQQNTKVPTNIDNAKNEKEIKPPNPKVRFKD